MNTFDGTVERSGVAGAARLWMVMEKYISKSSGSHHKLPESSSTIYGLGDNYVVHLYRQKTKSLRLLILYYTYRDEFT